MASSETIIENEGVDATNGPSPWVTDRPPARKLRASRRSRKQRLFIGLPSFVVGIAVVILATSQADGWPMAFRVVLAVVGIGLAYVGLDRLGRVVVGDKFDTALFLSLVWITVVVLAAVLANWLPLSESKDVSKTLTTPVLQSPHLFSAHPLGTDSQGLDILGGLIYGARVSLTVAIGAIAIGTVVGGMIGLMAGWFGGKFDAIVRLLTDSMLAFPPLVLLLAMVSILQASVLNVTLGLGVLGIPLYIRLARVNAMVYAPREFVLAAKALGARNGRIIFRELIPNVAIPILSYGFIIIGVLIVAEASLSFLGLSINRPNPTWGNMIAAAQDDFTDHPYQVLGPGATLFFTVFALNRIGDKARSIWDPQQRNQ